MKTAELRKLIGQTIRFKCPRSRRSLHDVWRGEVQEICRREVRISDDWYDIKTVELVEVVNG